MSTDTDTPTAPTHGASGPRAADEERGERTARGPDSSADSDRQRPTLRRLGVYALDGQWCAEFRKPSGKRVWTYHASEAEALAAKVEG